MLDLPLLPVFMIGLLGGVHCVGMCGGIVSAFSAAASTRVFPVAVSSGTNALAQAVVAEDVVRVLAYNAGRIGSYAVAGAIVGGIAQSVQALRLMSSLQIGGYWLANLMLMALGLYLMDVWRGLAHLETAGRLVWGRLRPLTKHLLPVDSAAKAFALGGLWGWVPCGMVYSVLLTAMLTGSAASGAAVMLAFGAGTLPVLLSMGMLGSGLQRWTRRRAVRITCGLIVLGFGLLGLFRVVNGLPLGWLDALCLAPSALPGGH